MNHLFGEYGLVIVQPDSKALKSLFTSVIEKTLTKAEILEQVEMIQNHVIGEDLSIDEATFNKVLSDANNSLAYQIKFDSEEVEKSLTEQPEARKLLDEGKKIYKKKDS